MQRVRKGDTVQVISGKDKGKTGTILEVIVRPSKNKKLLNCYVRVEGINLKSHFVKPNPQINQKGGILRKEAELHACKVLAWDPQGQKASRTGIKDVDGKKVRYLKSSGEVLDV